MTAARVLSLALLVTLVAGATRWQEPHRQEMFGTDEADYVRAMSLGLTANYLGTAERSGVSFVRDVVAEYRQTGWARPFKRDWDANDAAGLRHYHPPFSMYSIAGLARVTRDEATLRLTPLVQGSLAAGATVGLAFALLTGVPAGVRALLSAAAGLLVATSPYHVGASVDIGAHAAFSLVSTLTLLALTVAVSRRDARWWLAACALFGLATLTVPYWALLVLPIVWVWWTLPLVGGRRAWLGGRGILAAAVAATVAWPPFLLGAGFVKPALMYAGIVLRPLAQESAPGAWALELARVHPVLVASLALGAVAAPWRDRSRLSIVVPTLMFVLSFALLNLRVGHMKALYASDVLAALAALAVALTGAAFTRLPSNVAVAASAALTIAPLVMWAVRPAQSESRSWRPAMQALHGVMAGRRILVTPRPAGAIVKYYLPRADVVLDSSDPADRIAIAHELASRHIDAVLRWGATTEPGGATQGSALGAATGRVDVAGTIVSWWVLLE